MLFYYSMNIPPHLSSVSLDGYYGLKAIRNNAENLADHLTGTSPLFRLS